MCEQIWQNLLLYSIDEPKIFNTSELFYQLRLLTAFGFVWKHAPRLVMEKCNNLLHFQI